MTSADSDVEGGALVVGASSPIGRTIAVGLAGFGYTVTPWGQDRDRLDEATVGCAKAGPRPVVDLVAGTQHQRLPDLVTAVTARGPLRVVVWAPVPPRSTSNRSDGCGR